jgi:hypothetical protein
MYLRNLVREYQGLAVEEYYAKILVFAQSSGTGKSRLVECFGQECPMINFILREETTSFPLADRGILSFLREKLSPNKINIPHATRARVITDDLISNTDWVTKFSNEAPSQVRYELQSTIFKRPSPQVIMTHTWLSYLMRHRV